MTTRDFLIWLLLVPQLGLKGRWQLVSFVLAHHQGEELVPDKTVLSMLTRPADAQAFKKWYYRQEWLPSWRKLKSYPCVTILDAGYPKLLKEISQPPLVLFYQGDLTLIREPTLAVVGSRQLTRTSEVILKTWVPEFVQAGLTIVSGNARGADACAHQVTLAQGGKTIAVLGTGLDQVYPKIHTRLQAQISQQGLVLSEFLPWVGPKAWHFPLRNRIIVGLTLQVLVVQASLKSGSLVSAAIALDENRDLWSIPGPINQVYYQGSNQLLAQGAGMALCANDVIANRPLAWDSL